MVTSSRELVGGDTLSVRSCGVYDVYSGVQPFASGILFRCKFYVCGTHEYACFGPVIRNSIIKSYCVFNVIGVWYNIYSLHYVCGNHCTKFRYFSVNSVIGLYYLDSICNVLSCLP